MTFRRTLEELTNSKQEMQEDAALQDGHPPCIMTSPIRLAGYLAFSARTGSAVDE